MPRVSVVVPIYNVEPYLAECLRSVAGQTVDDFEVIMVDDGSTDASAAIAERFGERDRRFKLVSRPNGGLGRARNAGIDHAGGEFLAFLDSDDVLAPNACELLLGALDSTGSDFATGNVHRLTRVGLRQSPFLAATFERTRLKTHVTSFRPLIADRIAPNKLWRRSFWDEHGLRFPEGVVHEDIPVVVPAQFMARSVDVIADPVYRYRVRDGEDLSITQRRLEPRVLLDRLAAIGQVGDYLAREGPRDAKRWYDESVVADDLRYYVEVLERADDDYRALFLDRVNAFLDGASDRIFDPLPAIQRLRWHLIRRRLMPELLDVLRFEREDRSDTPHVRIGRHWYGDYPLRTDRRLAIPSSVYRLESELDPSATIEELRWDDDKLKVSGWAYIRGIGAPGKGSQRVEVTAVQPQAAGRWRRVRMQALAVRFKTTETHRPDATAQARQSLADLEWSGFEATLDPRALRSRGRWREGTWRLYVTIRARGVKRRVRRFWLADTRPLRAVDLPVGGDVRVAARPWDWPRRITLQVMRGGWAEVRGHRLADGDVELTGRLAAPVGAKARLTLTTEGAVAHGYPLEVDRSGSPPTFAVRVPVADLLGGEHDERRWRLDVVAGPDRRRLALPSDVEDGAWPAGDRGVTLSRSRGGFASLAVRMPQPVLTDARWGEDGALEVDGELPVTNGIDALVLSAGDRGELHAFPVGADEQANRFTCRLTPAGLTSLGGELPLATGTWELLARRDGGGDGGERATVAVAVGRGLDERLPLTAVVDHKPFTLAATRDRRAALHVRPDLDDHEAGSYHQRRLRRVAYAARRGEPLREAVLYSSFGGRQYSDSPRAIHEELVGRGAPLEHLWLVRDGACRVAAGATVVREGSREHFEALARARYVVFNDHFPVWFRRRPDQVCVQTWHGTPLKRLGFDVSRMWGVMRPFERRWGEQVANWQYVVSPNRFSTPILRRAFDIEGEMLETGYPRDDVLARADRDALGARVRRRLGLPEGVRTVLYAPTYRDDAVDGDGRHRLDLRLDLDGLRAALGRDAVLLLRKHHYIVDAVPQTEDGFVRDVSSYPDATELLLAADVLVTDYSSLMFDFANTGRPMVFFTYDLDAYKDRIRGFYLDFEQTAPGPLLRTPGELAEALSDLDAVRAGWRGRYEAFRAAFCELDDGAAAARVVDRFLAG